MSRVLILLALLLGSCVAASAQSPSNLPEDADNYSIIVVDSATSTPAGAALLSMLNSDPALRQIAEQCHRHKFTPDSPLYRERYAESLPPVNLPIFAMVRGDGGVIFKASGAAIPAAKELAAELTKRAELDRGMRQSDGVEYQSQNASIGGPFRDPLSRPLDRVIPDSLTVQPTLSTDGLWPIAAAIAGLVCVVLLGGFLIFVVGGGVVVVLLRR